MWWGEVWDKQSRRVSGLAGDSPRSLPQKSLRLRALQPLPGHTQKSAQSLLTPHHLTSTEPKQGSLGLSLLIRPRVSSPQSPILAACGDHLTGGSRRPAAPKTQLLGISSWPLGISKPPLLAKLLQGPKPRANPEDGFSKSSTLLP